MPSNTLRVMISSRCNDAFPAGGAALSDLRHEIKRVLEAERLLGKALFEVWINEDAPPADTSTDSLQVCLDQVDQADILIVLSNGNAGWAPDGADIGICHAELMRGTAVSPAKVRLIALSPEVTASSGVQGARDARFKAYSDTQAFFRGGSVKTADAAIARVKEAVFDAAVSLARLGLREARKGSYSSGEALAWSSLNFAQREERMTETLATSLADRGGRRNGAHVEVKILDEPTLFVVHAIPAAVSVPAARERVGRPFLNDHELAKQLKRAAGPVHVIGCHKGATDSQAMALLGFPDATIVRTPFGVHVADPIQKVQFVFLANCRDPSSTQFAVQRLFDWLAQSGEDRALVARARSRARIVKAVAAELCA